MSQKHKSFYDDSTRYVEISTCMRNKGKQRHYTRMGDGLGKKTPLFYSEKILACFRLRKMIKKEDDI